MGPDETVDNHKAGASPPAGEDARLPPDAGTPVGAKRRREDERQGTPAGNGKSDSSQQPAGGIVAGDSKRLHRPSPTAALETAPGPDAAVQAAAARSGFLPADSAVVPAAAFPAAAAAAAARGAVQIVPVGASPSSAGAGAGAGADAGAAGKVDPTSSPSPSHIKKSPPPEAAAVATEAVAAPAAPPAAPADGAVQLVPVSGSPSSGLAGGARAGPVVEVDPTSSPSPSHCEAAEGEAAAAAVPPSVAVLPPSGDTTRHTCLSALGNVGDVGVSGPAGAAAVVGDTGGGGGGTAASSDTGAANVAVKKCQVRLDG